jgi:hypothetical protein
MQGNQHGLFYIAMFGDEQLRSTTSLHQRVIDSGCELPPGLLETNARVRHAFLRTVRDPPVELLVTFLVMFHYSLDELSELPVLSALFEVGQLIVFRFFHQFQIALVPIHLQRASFNCSQECAASFLSMSAIGKPAVLKDSNITKLSSRQS